MKKMDIIVNAYNKTTKGMVYDLPFAASNMGLFNKPAKEVPKMFYDFVMREKKGCCIYFAMAMIHLLNEEGIDAYLVSTPEGNGQKASVGYKLDGVMYVADPVETVKGTKGDFVKIPLEEFASQFAWTNVYDPYGETSDRFFLAGEGGFMEYPLDEIKKEE